MKIVVTAEGAGLDAPASPVFGRCPVYVFVETEAMEVRSVENPAMNSASGAGIAGAQFVLKQGAEAVVTGNVGPNAHSVFQASDVPVYMLDGGTVRDVVEAYKEGKLPKAGGATGPAHAGLAGGRGRGAGREGGGRGVSTRTSIPVSIETGSQAPSTSSREEEISALQKMASDLRKQLAEVIDRLDQLEEE